MIESMGCLAACKERRSELELPTMYKPTCKGGWFWRSDATRGQRPTRRAENNGNGLIYQIIRYQNHDLSYPDKHVASYIHLNPYLSTTYRLNLATYNWPAPVQRTSPETVSGRSFVRSLARSFVLGYRILQVGSSQSKISIPHAASLRRRARCTNAPPSFPRPSGSSPSPLACPDRCSGHAARTAAAAAEAVGKGLKF